MFSNITSSLFKLGVRQKVILVLLTVLLTAISLSTWLTLKHEKRTLLDQINQRGSDISRFVAKSLAYSVIGYDYHTIQLLVDEITLSEDVGYARVISIKGNVMAESSVYSNGGNEDLVMFSQEITLEDDVVGILELGLSTKKTIDYLEEHKYIQVKREALIILLIALGEFFALSYIIIRPLSLMTSALKDGADESGRIVKKLPVFSEDEFGRMAEAFNSLGDKLNAAHERLQSDIDIADEELLQTNRRLIKQSKELQRVNEKFKRLSITDELTGLYNRRHFQELIQSDIEVSIRYGNSNSLLLIDLDFFKKINDNYGHPCGDQVLKEVSKTVKFSLRKTDILCRIGGEEFAVLCRQADRGDATDVAEKIRSIVEKSAVTCGDDRIRCTISIGISTFDGKDKNQNLETIYRESDLALYHAKKSGRNTVVHYDNLSELDKAG
jgi:diguanylate cyclase (GGDEF)-like protein